MCPTRRAWNYGSLHFGPTRMLIGACGTYEVSARVSGNATYRAAVGLALATAFLLVWMNLAVGIIGSEDNPANLLYGGVLAVAFIGVPMPCKYQ